MTDNTIYIEPLREPTQQEIIDKAIQRGDVVPIDQNGAEELDVVKVVPHLRPEGMPGLIGEIVDAYKADNEVIPELLADNLLSKICVHLDKVFLRHGERTIRLNANWSIQMSGTGKGKGSSEELADSFWREAIVDPVYMRGEQEVSRYNPAPFCDGLSSGEGFIYEIRDPSGYDEEAGTFRDQGVTDKRLHVIEQEFSQIMVAASREGSTLSAQLRKAHDCRTLNNKSRNNRLTATNPHVLVTAHITPTELIELAEGLHFTNGFLNRFKFIYGQCLKYVMRPKPVPPEKKRELAARMGSIIGWAQNQDEFELTDDFYQAFEKVFHRLRNPTGDTLRQSLLARCDHKVKLLSMLFAIIDKTTLIKSKHLKSAMAWIDYSEASIDYVWSTELQQQLIAQNNEFDDELLKVIRLKIDENDGNPIGKTPLSRHYNNNRKITAKEINASLKRLQERTPQPLEVKKTGISKYEISLLDV
jgi:hypothetical protein